MGVEPLEDTLPLPQIVRSMKSITIPSHGRSISVFDNSASVNVDGGGQPSSQTRRQETCDGSFEQREEICSRSRDDRIWDEVTYLLDSLERTKALLTNGTDWDLDEVKWINERYRLCKRQALNYVLRLNLAEVLASVSYPGERLSYLSMAERTIADCTKWELEQAIREIGLNPYERIYFKAKDERPSLEQLEQLLLTMASDVGYICAGEFNKRLNLEPHTASYKAIKRDLMGIGWIWSQKKINGKVVKIIKR